MNLDYWHVIVTVIDGKIRWVSTARTRSGAEASKRKSMRYAPFHRDYQVKIISVAELIAWEQRGVDELEALVKL